MKFAMMVLELSAARVVVVAVPVLSPLQEEKEYPLAGRASRVTVDPAVIPEKVLG